MFTITSSWSKNVDNFQLCVFFFIFLPGIYAEEIQSGGEDWTSMAKILLPPTGSCFKVKFIFFLKGRATPPYPIGFSVGCKRLSSYTVLLNDECEENIISISDS